MTGEGLAPQSCSGPLIWYDVEPHDAILECACGYLIVAGNFLDEEHAETPLLREGA
jgi:hypothetical protein